LLEEHYKLGRSEQETLDIVSKDRSANFFDLCKAKQYLKAYFSMKPYVEGITQCDSYCEELFLTKARPFGVQLPAPIKAFVDRIDITNKGTFIIDYKTTSREPEQDQHVDQMIIYKWAVEEEWGLKVEDAYVASIYEPDPRYLKQSITDIKESMLVDKIFKTDEEVCASMETRCYQKNRGQWCNWCPLKQACEIDSEMIIEEKAEEQTNGTNK
jgi:CRISPR/Cas system-associated exonuclease Cas4 (RecB family)